MIIVTIDQHHHHGSSLPLLIIITIMRVIHNFRYAGTYFFQTIPGNLTYGRKTAIRLKAVIAAKCVADSLSRILPGEGCSNKQKQQQYVLLEPKTISGTITESHWSLEYLNMWVALLLSQTHIQRDKRICYITNIVSMSYVISWASEYCIN